ncbi:hypothetical protein LHFGNBLO_006029 (plasmid) [Mesorhizobium sp. AR10]|uniref:hypothetical protein n=1 Tax=Mesorhizobium sp. AR10 TaxID=2865839 RepID=UPI00215DDB2B|nr:hypothetical protein [Mesorhizobium sp. AR10]UVK35815.1 hypothetical protein LHFGNBLO_006029 [Mesorhizobium sp. AR10]
MVRRTPEFRRLRVYAIDPGLAARHETVGLNELTLMVPWESNPIIDGVLSGTQMLGPVGNYLEVVDYDPASGCHYAPVDLNETFVLAQDGLSPSELNPQFHQQMVYAVAMTTIDKFERALGRSALWAPRRLPDKSYEYVPRLRLYPHALREANAYYNPDKKAVLFGYFQVPPDSTAVAPGTTVFTCLSHDVIAHEVTHALLDGLHRRFAESTNVDVLGLHEGFADIVAIFQHFSNPDVLKDQIGRTRGHLEKQNMLGQLAQQFGRATRRGEALRDALGYTDKEGNWQRYKPNPTYLRDATEAHERGAILVAAVFDAFLKMYKSRIVDLLRIASQGTGQLPAGELNIDLVNRLADEAAKTSEHVLQMCIRALDYCPPVNVTFGDYLQAIITADADLYPADEHNYRTAVMQSFSLFGIRPRAARNVSLEGLLLQAGDASLGEAVPPGMQADLDNEIDRKAAYERMEDNARKVHEWLARPERAGLLEAMGIVTGTREKVPGTVSIKKGRPVFEVHSVRAALRRGSKTNLVPDLVIEITQRRAGYFDKKDQKAADDAKPTGDAAGKGDFIFRRGCTLVVNQQTRNIRWVARTHKNICDDGELDALRQFLLSNPVSVQNAFHGPVAPGRVSNPFAAVHRD